MNVLGLSLTEIKINDFKIEFVIYRNNLYMFLIHKRRKNVKMTWNVTKYSIEVESSSYHRYKSHKIHNVSRQFVVFVWF